MTETVHIVCLDAPSPPDYGGAIDMYYMVRSMAETGGKIILHYFDYKPGRGVDGLQDLCTEVHSYKRKPFLLSGVSSQPYIIHSRASKKLIDRLNKDEHSVILSGIHCAGIIPHLKKTGGVVIRMLNEETSYYQKLAETEQALLKRKYFTRESKSLEQYQGSMQKNVPLACLSKTDMAIFSEKYGFKSVHFIPCFIPWQQLSIKEGKGTYCLYHGNMSVSENEQAALWLINHVFSGIEVPFIIAGKKISGKIKAAAKSYKNISFVDDPPDERLVELIANAHINTLPSMNATGVKLKILHVLFRGRFCIANASAVEGTDLQGVLVAEDSKVWKEQILRTMKKDFTGNEIEERKKLLSTYSNKRNAEKLSSLL